MLSSEIMSAQNLSQNREKMHAKLNQSLGGLKVGGAVTFVVALLLLAAHRLFGLPTWVVLLLLAFPLVVLVGDAINVLLIRRKLR